MALLEDLPPAGIRWRGRQPPQGVLKGRVGVIDPLGAPAWTSLIALSLTPARPEASRQGAHLAESMVVSSTPFPRSQG
jgi:hypothetical protein